MTATIGSALTAKTIQHITAANGVNSNLAALIQAGQASIALLTPAQVSSQNAPAELIERSAIMQYPALHVYCEKITNSQIEKYRSFSGTAQMTIEVRHSQDRLEGLQDTVERYAGAVTQTLDRSRGDWGGGTYYAGGYQVTFGAAKHGGKNFTQVAKVTFEIGVSIN